MDSAGSSEEPRVTPAPIRPGVSSRGKAAEESQLQEGQAPGAPSTSPLRAWEEAGACRAEQHPGPAHPPIRRWRASLRIRRAEWDLCKRVYWLPATWV